MEDGTSHPAAARLKAGNYGSRWADSFLPHAALRRSATSCCGQQRAGLQLADFPHFAMNGPHGEAWIGGVSTRPAGDLVERVGATGRDGKMAVGPLYSD